MKNLIYILGIFLLIFNCSKNNDDEVIQCDTFLSCNNETTWKYVETINSIEYSSYIKLIDNVNNPFKTWVSYTGIDCGYDYFGEPSPQFQIIENLKDKLILKVIWPEGDDGYETWTMTLQDNSLKLVSVYYQQEQINTLYNKTSENIDDFIFCEKWVKSI